MRLDPSRRAIEEWGHVRVGRTAPYVSPAFYPVVSEGSMNGALRGKDARFQQMMYGGTQLARRSFDELDSLDDEDDEDLLFEVSRRRARSFGAEWESYGADDVYAAVDEAKQAAAEAKRAARVARRKAAQADGIVTPFEAISNLFKRKDGGATPAEKALVTFRNLTRPPQPAAPPPPQIIERVVEIQRTTGKEMAIMAGIGVAMLGIGVATGMAIQRGRS